MALAKKFLHKRTEALIISPSKRIIGLIIGLIFSFVFYSFLYLSREVFRIISTTETYDVWILTDKEINFYNLIFAFISVIIAQSVTISFWIDRPRRMFEKHHNRKISILNDQRAMNCFFLLWFSKLAICYGIFFGFTYHGSYSNFSFTPEYNYLFVLMIFVLFLQTWNTIRLVYKKQSLKWMFLVMLFLSLIAFALSQINLIDYKTINQNLIKNNIHYKYDLVLPETNCCETDYKHWFIKNIYVVKLKNQPVNSSPKIIVDNVEIKKEELRGKIREWQLVREECEIPMMVYQLHIHKTTKMAFVYQIKNELMELGIRRIAYAVFPINQNSNLKLDRNYTFSMALPNYKLDKCSFKEGRVDFRKFQNIISVRLTETDLKINNTLIHSDQFKSKIKKIIIGNFDYIINLEVNKNVDFIHYFEVLSGSKEAVIELREEYSKKWYSQRYDSLGYEENIEVREKIPFRIFDIIEEL